MCGVCVCACYISSVCGVLGSRWKTGHHGWMLGVFIISLQEGISERFVCGFIRCRMRSH